jgi:hypothetical protein
VLSDIPGLADGSDRPRREALLSHSHANLRGLIAKPIPAYSGASSLHPVDRLAQVEDKAMAVVLDLDAAAADLVGAAVDPHSHRPPTSLVSRRDGRPRWGARPGRLR